MNPIYPTLGGWETEHIFHHYEKYNHSYFLYNSLWQKQISQFPTFECPALGGGGKSFSHASLSDSTLSICNQSFFSFTGKSLVSEVVKEFQKYDGLYEDTSCMLPCGFHFSIHVIFTRI